MYMNAHKGTIHSSWEVETAQMSIDWSEDKESGILFSHKSEWSSLHATVMINLENTMHAKWNKTVTKDHIWFHLFSPKHCSVPWLFTQWCFQTLSVSAYIHL